MHPSAPKQNRAKHEKGEGRGTPGPVIEICVDTLAGAQAAAAGGADRIELCSALSEWGLTPSLGMVQQALRSVAIPVHVIVRPRSGDFVYSPDEFAAMEWDIEAFKAAGVQGIVVGVLRKNGVVDVERTRALVELAAPLPVTFHRAFDECVDLKQSLEDVIACGARMLLTSGGAETLARGASKVAELVRLAGDRIEIIASAGVTVETGAGLWRATKASAMHASLRRSGGRKRESADAEPLADPSPRRPGGPLEGDVRALVESFGR